MKIRKSVRCILQILSILLALFFAFLIMREFMAERHKEEIVPAYTYDNQGSVQYNVFLKPNTLYSQRNLNEGNIYITELVDHIEVTFEYNFIGERPADISGNYEIVAMIEGYMNTAKEEPEISQSEVSSKTIWKKDFAITPETNFQTSEDHYSVTKRITLDYNEYNAMSKEIISLTKLSIPTRLVALMNIHIQVKTDEGNIEENHTQSIIVPFGANSFEIKKNGIGEKSGKLTESKIVQIPVNRKSIYIYGSSILLAIVAFFFITFLTRGQPTDEHVLELNKIFKKYDSRLVAVRTILTGNCEKNIKVRTMDDLVKLADEVGKPIIYPYSENPKEICQFYVFSDSWFYEYNLADQIHESEITTERKEKSKGIQCRGFEYKNP